MWIYITIGLFMVVGVMALYFKMEEVKTDLDIAEYCFFGKEMEDED